MEESPQFVELLKYIAYDFIEGGQSVDSNGDSTGHTRISRAVDRAERLLQQRQVQLNSHVTRRSPSNRIGQDSTQNHRVSIDDSSNSF